MTRFLDGPAAGVTLMLRRAPVFLRAVTTDGGTWDALDQLDDSPQSTERIVVYRLDGEPTWCHIRATKGGGVYRGGAYRVLEHQPADERVRSTAAWRAWVGEQVGEPVGEDGGIVGGR
jgi:hypothetical protein